MPEDNQQQLLTQHQNMINVGTKLVNAIKSYTEANEPKKNVIQKDKVKTILSSSEVQRTSQIGKAFISGVLGEVDTFIKRRDKAQRMSTSSDAKKVLKDIKKAEEKKKPSFLKKVFFLGGIMLFLLPFLRKKFSSFFENIISLVSPFISQIQENMTGIGGNAIDSIAEKIQKEIDEETPVGKLFSNMKDIAKTVKAKLVDIGNIIVPPDMQKLISDKMKEVGELVEKLFGPVDTIANIEDMLEEGKKTAEEAYLEKKEEMRNRALEYTSFSSLSYDSQRKIAEYDDNGQASEARQAIEAANLNRTRMLSFRNSWANLIPQGGSEDPKVKQMIVGLANSMVRGMKTAVYDESGIITDASREAIIKQLKKQYESNDSKELHAAIDSLEGALKGANQQQVEAILAAMEKESGKEWQVQDIFDRDGKKIAGYYDGIIEGLDECVEKAKTFQVGAEQLQQYAQQYATEILGSDAPQQEIQKLAQSFMESCSTVEDMRAAAYKANPQLKEKHNYEKQAGVYKAILEYYGNVFRESIDQWYNDIVKVFLGKLSTYILNLIKLASSNNSEMVQVSELYTDDSKTKTAILDIASERLSESNILHEENENLRRIAEYIERAKAKKKEAVVVPVPTQQQDTGHTSVIPGNPRDTNETETYG